MARSSRIIRFEAKKHRRKRQKLLVNITAENTIINSLVFQRWLSACKDAVVLLHTQNSFSIQARFADNERFGVVEIHISIILRPDWNSSQSSDGIVLKFSQLCGPGFLVSIAWYWKWKVKRRVLLVGVTRTTRRPSTVFMWTPSPDPWKVMLVPLVGSVMVSNWIAAELDMALMTTDVGSRINYDSKGVTNQVDLDTRSRRWNISRRRQFWWRCDWPSSAWRRLSIPGRRRFWWRCDWPCAWRRSWTNDRLRIAHTLFINVRSRSLGRVSTSPEASTHTWSKAIHHAVEDYKVESPRYQDPRGIHGWWYLSLAFWT